METNGSACDLTLVAKCFVTREFLFIQSFESISFGFFSIDSCKSYIDVCICTHSHNPFLLKIFSSFDRSMVYLFLMSLDKKEFLLYCSILVFSYLLV